MAGREDKRVFLLRFMDARMIHLQEIFFLAKISQSWTVQKQYPTVQMQFETHLGANEVIINDNFHTYLTSMSICI